MTHFSFRAIVVGSLFFFSAMRLTYAVGSGSVHTGNPYFRITTAALDYDFELRMRRPCDLKSSDNTCTGPSVVHIFGKGESVPSQTLALANVFVTVGSDGQPLTNIPGSSVVLVGDFNFDGHDDLAIQTGNAGPYRSPSYTVYLFDPTARRFVENRSLSRLTETSMGLFEIDKRAKQLRAWNKIGCCDQTVTRYRVLNNQLVAVAIHDENVLPGEQQSVVTDDRLVHGRWQHAQHNEPLIGTVD